LTDQRLVFTGGLRSVDAELPKMTSVEGGEDSLIVHTTGKQKTQIFAGFGSQTATFEVAGRTYDGLVTGVKVQEAIETLVHLAR
jgi:hypothetical protein